MPKYTTLNDQLAHYLEQHHTGADDPVLADLQSETRALGDVAGMQIAPDQGAFMQMLVAACNAKLAVEIGTFTGYSSICIARALAQNDPDRTHHAHLHCFDISDEYTSIARQFWQRAQLEDRITLHLGPANENLNQLSDQPIDFVFIDADKTGYDTYYEMILPRVRTGGLILFDNMLWHGKLVDPSIQDDDTRAIRALNDKLTADSRIHAVLTPIGDGIHICTKL